jgi:hypothetical protein
MPRPFVALCSRRPDRPGEHHDTAHRGVHRRAPRDEGAGDRSQPLPIASSLLQVPGGRGAPTGEPQSAHEGAQDPSSPSPGPVRPAATCPPQSVRGHGVSGRARRLPWRSIATDRTEPDTLPPYVRAFVAAAGGSEGDLMRQQCRVEAVLGQAAAQPLAPGGEGRATGEPCRLARRHGRALSGTGLRPSGRRRRHCAGARAVARARRAR